MSKDTSVIPYGYYCYTHIRWEKRYSPEWGQEVPVEKVRPCPYWYWHPPDMPEEDIPYCEYLDSIGEWELEGCYPSLWDQCKECGVNLPEEEEDV